MDEEIRQKIINLHLTKGVKYTFIAQKINVHRSTLCHYLKNDRRVTPKVAKNLIIFLQENN